jgi:hypothetical protein
MSLDLSVVVTTYNSADVVGGLLDSMSALDPAESPAEVVVVDNASSDRTLEEVRGRAGVTVIPRGRNLGLSRANNIGAAAASSGHLLFLNPDVRVREGALAALMQTAAERPDAALLGPAMYDSGGRLQSTARTYPSLMDIALRRTPLGRSGWGGRRLRRHLFPVDDTRTSRVDWLVGAAIWLTPAGRSAVGLMSERFFLYFEDVEWCWRAASRGMDVLYVPAAAMEHVPRRESASGAGRVLWHHLASMVKFYVMHPGCSVGLAGNARKGSACH